MTTGRTPGADVHVVGARPAVSPHGWRAAATRHERTWWEDWVVWAADQAGALVAPPGMGSAVYPPLGDAPGDYIHS